MQNYFARYVYFVLIYSYKLVGFRSRLSHLTGISPMTKMLRTPPPDDSSEMVPIQARVKKKLFLYIKGEADAKHEGKPAPVIRAMLAESYEARTGAKL